MTSAQTLPTVTGSEAYIGAVVLAGSSQGASAFKVAPVNKREGIVPLELTVGANTLTRALCNSDILISTASGNTSLFVPLLANITDIGSYAWVSGGLELGFRIERRGPGIFALTFDAGATVEDPFALRDPIQFTIKQYMPISVGLIGVNHWRLG